jgi:hypothetical protein
MHYETPWFGGTADPVNFYQNARFFSKCKTSNIRADKLPWKQNLYVPSPKAIKLIWDAIIAPATVNVNLL